VVFAGKYFLEGVNCGSWVNSALRKTELFAGFDSGFVRHYGGREANRNEGESFLTGWAVGLRFNGRKLNFDVTYAQSVHTEDFIGRSSEIYANLIWNLF